MELNKILQLKYKIQHKIIEYIEKVSYIYGKMKNVQYV